MTRFNPDLKHKTPQEWSEEAYKITSQNNLQFHVIGGLALSILVAGATTPVTGALIAAYTLYTAWTRSGDIQRNQEAIIDTGCVAQVLEGDSFQDYINQCGHDAVINELSYAQKRGLTLSNDALDYLEDCGNQTGLLARTALSSTSVLGQSIGTNTNTPQVTVIDNYDPSDVQIDIIKEMTDRITTMLIVGVSNSGKGILASNAVREAKCKHPKLKVVVIDPKEDKREVGYWDGVADKIISYPCMDASPSAVAEWADYAFKQYQDYANQNEQTLAVIDEGTLLGQKLNNAKSTLLKDKVTSYTSAGDSSGRFVWFLVQSPFVGSASLDLSASSQMITIAIHWEGNLGALSQWKGSKLLKKLSLDAVGELIDKSPIGRAIYYGKTDKWYPLQELTNHSGYNRDKREYLPGFEPTIDSASNNLNPISDLNTSLSHAAQLVLEWLLKNRPTQWIKYRGKEDRDMSFVKFCSEKGIDAEARDKSIQELLTAEKIDISPDQDYIKTI
jgi:hypothetical protein